MDDRTLLHLVLVLTVLSLATNVMVLKEVRTADTPAQGPPANINSDYLYSVPPLFIPHGFAPPKDDWLDHGHVDSFSLAGTQLMSDLSVTDHNGTEKEVFCVLEGIMWYTWSDPSGPMLFICRISRSNKERISAILAEDPSDPEVELDFTIYTRLEGIGVYHLHWTISNLQRMRVPVARFPKEDLSLSLSDQPASWDGSPETYGLMFGIAPPTDRVYPIRLCNFMFPSRCEHTWEFGTLHG